MRLLPTLLTTLLAAPSASAAALPRRPGGLVVRSDGLTARELPAELERRLPDELPDELPHELERRDVSLANHHQLDPRLFGFGTYRPVLMDFYTMVIGFWQCGRNEDFEDDHWKKCAGKWRDYVKDRKGEDDYWEGVDDDDVKWADDDSKAKRVWPYYLNIFPGLWATEQWIAQMLVDIKNSGDTLRKDQLSKQTLPVPEGFDAGEWEPDTPLSQKTKQSLTSGMQTALGFLKEAGGVAIPAAITSVIGDKEGKTANPPSYEEATASATSTTGKTSWIDRIKQKLPGKDKVNQAWANSSLSGKAGSLKDKLKGMFGKGKTASSNTAAGTTSATTGTTGTTGATGTVGKLKNGVKNFFGKGSGAGATTGTTGTAGTAGSGGLGSKLLNGAKGLFKGGSGSGGGRGIGSALTGALGKLKGARLGGK